MTSQKGKVPNLHARVPFGIWRDESLSLEARGFFGYLAYVWMHKRDHKDWVKGCRVSIGLRYIREDLRTSYRVLERVIRELCDGGHIGVEETDNGKRRWYVLRYPEFGWRDEEERE